MAPMGYSGVWGKLIHEKKTYVESLVSDLIYPTAGNQDTAYMPLPMTSKFNSSILRYVIHI
jgi:hypothetical protein